MAREDHEPSAYLREKVLPFIDEPTKNEIRNRAREHRREVFAASDKPQGSLHETMLAGERRAGDLRHEDNISLTPTAPRTSGFAGKGGRYYYRCRWCGSEADGFRPGDPGVRQHACGHLPWEEQGLDPDRAPYLDTKFARDFVDASFGKNAIAPPGVKYIEGRGWAIRSREDYRAMARANSINGRNYEVL